MIPREFFGGIGRFVRDEAEQLGFRLQPTIIVAWVCFALAIPYYHPGGEWFWRIVSWLGLSAQISYLQHIWLGPEFAIQAVGSLVVILLLRESPRAYGLGLGDWRFGLKATGLCYLLYAPLFVIFCTSHGFAQYYGTLANTITTTRKFFMWEVPAGFFFMVKTEFFFRGFLLFGMKKYFGVYAAIIATMIPFVVWHFNKPEIETFGSFPVGLALAYLAVRTGSIWYGLLLHWSIAVLLSAVAIWMALSSAT